MLEGKNIHFLVYLRNNPGLIKKGADPNTNVQPERFPAQFALTADRPEIFEEFLSSGADPNKLIPLWTSTLIKKARFMRIVLAHVEKLSTAGKENLLKSVLEMDEQTACTAVLKLGFKSTLRDGSGRPLLIGACSKGYKDLAELLLKQGAEINETDGSGNTALMVSSWNSSAEIVKLLLDNGAKANLKNDKFSTALSLACEKGNTEIVTSLLNGGADPNVQGWKNQSALMIALSKGQTGPAKVLCATKGIEINAKDDDGFTALMFASYRGDAEMIRILSECGAAVDAQDLNGNTALMFASRKGLIRAVRLLLENGADVNIKNKRGKTALGIADNRKQKEVMQILKGKRGHY